jgi:hypothetical protein
MRMSTREDGEMEAAKNFLAELKEFGMWDGITETECGSQTGFETDLESRWRIKAPTFARMGGERARRSANDKVTSCSESTPRSGNPGATSRGEG